MAEPGDTARLRGAGATSHFTRRSSSTSTPAAPGQQRHPRSHLHLCLHPLMLRPLRRHSHQRRHPAPETPQHHIAQSPTTPKQQTDVGRTRQQSSSFRLRSRKAPNEASSRCIPDQAKGRIPGRNIFEAHFGQTKAHPLNEASSKRTPGRRKAAFLANYRPDVFPKKPRTVKTPLRGKISPRCIQNELTLARYARHASERPRKTPLGNTSRGYLAIKTPFYRPNPSNHAWRANLATPEGRLLLGDSYHARWLLSHESCHPRRVRIPLDKFRHA